jgi:class 3 adenylate cyclase
MERKLTTIFCADVVGYSKMMSLDEEETLRTLSECRTIIDKMIVDYSGRIFGSAGDSVLAEFPSAVMCIKFSALCQQELYKRNLNSTKPKMRFRFGIHLGDVVIQGNNLMGDVVNIAARIESMADYGGISMSETVYNEVKSKIHDLIFVDRGLQNFKNIPKPIRIYSVDVVGAEKNPNSVNETHAEKTIAKFEATGITEDTSTPDVIRAILNDKSSASVSFNVAMKLKSSCDYSTAVKVFLSRTVTHKDFSSFEELINMTEHNLIPKEYNRAVAGVFEAGSKMLLKPELQYKVGKFFADGVFGKEREYLAIHVWKNAAEKNSDAQTDLGMALLQTGNEKDIAEGLKHLEEQARQKNIKCILKLGSYYYDRGDFANSFRWYWVARQYKDMTAQKALESMSHSITRAQFQNYQIDGDSLIEEIRTHKMY